MLDLFGRNPAQFVFRNAEAIDIAQFALLKRAWDWWQSRRRTR